MDAYAANVNGCEHPWSLCVGCEFLHDNFIIKIKLFFSFPLTHDLFGV